jgi:excinuclease UvrABC nuclease subunit
VRRTTRSFATAPNLVVIDGGKGQLSAALAAMQAYDLRASR